MSRGTTLTIRRRKLPRALGMYTSLNDREITPLTRAKTDSDQHTQHAGDDICKKQQHNVPATPVAPGTTVRTLWVVDKPGSRDYGEGANELNSLKLVAKRSVFEQGAHVPVSHFGYLKHPSDAFLSEL